MSRPEHALPAGFETLEGFVERWAMATTAQRAHTRDTSSPAERDAFYAAAGELLPAALEQLDRKPLHSLDDSERRLMNLMLALGHVVLAIEVQGAVEPAHREVRTHMRITRSPADAEPGRP